MWCNVGVAENVLKEKIEKIQDLLKGNYKCQSILTQGKWTFSFSKISRKNYYIENDSDKTSGKKFAELKYNILFWYYILPVEGDSVLIANVLKLEPKRDENFMSIIIFFDGDFTKEDLRKLKDSSNESEQAFFNHADNFVETRINSGSQGNFQNFDRGICKSDYKPLKKIPKLSNEQKEINKKKLLEQLKKYKPTELAPGVKKKTN
jgi:hypothetical protein